MREGSFLERLYETAIRSRQVRSIFLGPYAAPCNRCLFYKNIFILTRIKHEAIKYNICSTCTLFAAVIPQNDSTPNTNQKYKQSYANITVLQCIAIAVQPEIQSLNSSKNLSPSLAH